MRAAKILPAFLFCGLVVTVPLLAAERHIMPPRVPADQLAVARALKSPLADSPETIQKGKVLYEGKGTCFSCHGMTGGGDGPGGASLNPSPRNFHHYGMWRHRTEGEIFWVIKNGSPGTGMIPFGGMLTDEEIWALIQYERTFAGGPGRRGMGPPHGRGPRGGMGMDPGGRGGRGGMGGMGRGEDGCCQESESTQ